MSSFRATITKFLKVRGNKEFRQSIMKWRSSCVLQLPLSRKYGNTKNKLQSLDVPAAYLERYCSCG